MGSRHADAGTSARLEWRTSGRSDSRRPRMNAVARGAVEGPPPRPRAWTAPRCRPSAAPPSHRASDRARRRSERSSIACPPTRRSSSSRRHREAAAAGRPIITTGCGTSARRDGIAALINEAIDCGLAAKCARSSLWADARPARGLLIAISPEGGTHITNEARTARASAHGRLRHGGGVAGAARGARDSHEEADQSWCHTVGTLAPHRRA